MITKYPFILKDHAHAALMLELCLTGFRFTTLDSLFLIRHDGIREEEEKRSHLWLLRGDRGDSTEEIGRERWTNSK